jgi:hypothetical protein
LVLPAKIFEFKEDINFGLIALKLKDFKEEITHTKENGENIKLVTQILDLKLEKKTLFGVISVDFLLTNFYRRKIIGTIVTEEAPFWIIHFGKRTFLIVSAPSIARGVKKLLTGNIANKLSEILFITSHNIVETRVTHEKLKEIHEANPEATKLIWFDDVTFPGVEKLCLAGPDIVNTQLYRDYIEHGKIWYVVFEVRRLGIVVGITRNCVVTLFSKSSKDEFINYISEYLPILFGQ